MKEHSHGQEHDLELEVFLEQQSHNFMRVSSTGGIYGSMVILSEASTPD